MSQVVQAAAAASRAKPPFSYGVLLNKTNELVENELAAIDASRLGFDKDADIAEQVDRFRDGQIYTQVINHDVINKVITDKMVKEKYQQLLNEFHVRHIYFAKMKRQITPDDREQADRLRRQLMREGDFDALARQFSQDSLSAGKGGDLGFLRWGDRGWGDPFYQAVAKLKRGQISHVIESDKGLHLIKLEEIRRVNQPPLKVQMEDLRRTFYRAKGKALDSTYSDFVQQMEKKYKLVYPEGSADSLLKFVVSTPARGADVQKDPLQFLETLTEEQRGLALAKYSGGVFTVEDAVRNYERISPRRRPMLDNTKEIQTFFSRNVPRRLIIAQGYRNGYQRKPAVLQAVTNEQKRLLADRVRKLKVTDKLEVTAEDVEKFYQQNPHLFITGSMMDVQQILVKNEALAYDLYDRLLGGEDFAELAKTYSEGDDKEQEGRLGWISDQTKGGVTATASKLTPGEISKPFKVADGYAIIKVLDRQGGDVADFAKSENRAKRELRVQLRAQLEKEWLDQVRASVPVVINKAVIRKEAGIESY